MNKFTDRAAISGTRKTDDGFLVTEAFAVRSGIQLYSGSEVGILNKQVVRVWRPESEVRDVASIKTFTHAPITMGHPSEMVTADNWAALAKGEVSTEAEWVGDKIRLPLIVKDAAAIAAIEGGTRELSAGYTARLEYVDGVTPDGQAYDAIQREIRINHLAIVPRGRAGHECRIGDADTWGASPVTDAGKEQFMTLRKIMVDGLEVETTEPGAIAIAKLQDALTAKGKSLTDALADHAKAIAAKDAELAAKDAEIVKLKAAQLSDADLDARVATRAKLIADAKLIAKDIKTDGVADAEIRKAAVTVAYGDAMISGKSAEYIAALFDLKVADAAKEDPLKKPFKPTIVGDSTSAYADYVNSFKKEA